MTELAVECDAVERDATGERMDSELRDVVAAESPRADTEPSSDPAAAPAPLPLLKGTLSYNLQARRHILRGMWNYEASTEYSPQRFELIRSLGPDEDPTQLPKDGEFHGSFSLSYFVITSKGKRKERTKVISETGVRIRFEMDAEHPLTYRVHGEGTNQFGVFHIGGTATKSALDGDPTFHIILRKKYVAMPALRDSASASSSPQPDSTHTQSLDGGEAHKVFKKRKLFRDDGEVNQTSSEPGDPVAGDDQATMELLPSPSTMYESNVVCLRGKLSRESFQPDDVVHKISGLWSSGLNLILQDTDNNSGLCNRFEYEHKCTGHNDIFPLSGRYMGWFNLTLENGARTRIVERDVLLKFRKNNAGYFNVEGKGSNVFGKYTITGTVTDDYVITIFRHFQPMKLKNTPNNNNNNNITPSTTTDNPPLSIPSHNHASNAHIHQNQHKPTLCLDDVHTPAEDSDHLLPIEPPLHGLYSAVSRGVLRANEDGAHTCSGKWAITREHYNQNISSNFHFGLEADHVKLAEKQHHVSTMHTSSSSSHTQTNGGMAGEPTPFPVDSAFYKGSFKIRRGTTKFQTVVDQQIVLKFRKNNAGTFNVYGKGINDIGTYDLIGTLILSGRASGHVELYRMYPIQTAPNTITSQDESYTLPTSTVHPTLIQGHKKNKAVERDDREHSNANSSLPQQSSFPPPPLIRRESSRLIKVPLRLESDDSSSQSLRIMEKCSLLLKVMRDKDAMAGSFFAVPVDPVALNLPTYHQIIKNPMDLGTIQNKMDSNAVTTPEQFASLVRLVFENAIKFNEDPTHVVNITARNMLSLFNSKYSDIQRLIDTVNRDKKMGKLEAKWTKFKDEKKLKKRHETEDPKTAALAQLRLSADEAANVLDSLSSSYSTLDHNMLIQLFRLLQTQTSCIQKFLVALHSEKSTSSFLTAQDVGTAASVSSSVLNKSFESYAERKPKKTKKRPSSDDEFAATMSSSAIMKSIPPPSKPILDVVVHMNEEPLTHEEQQELTEAINSMTVDKLKPVADIIRESAALHDEDTEEIEIDINQLDTTTQRKLQRYVMKNVKLKKIKKHGLKKGFSAHKSSTLPSSTRHPGKSKPVTTSNSLFAFGGAEEDHEFSDLDDEGIGPLNTSNASSSKTKMTKLDDTFNTGTQGVVDDHDEDMELDANWNFTSSAPMPTKDGTNIDGYDEEEDDDDAWAAARGASEAQKALDKDRRALEEKIRADAETAKGKHMAEAAAMGKKKLLERREREAEEAQQRLLKEQEERERAQKARDHAFQTLQLIQPTVDLDAQRDVMKEYEQSFYDKDLGGGESPSSDFGF